MLMIALSPPAEWFHDYPFWMYAGALLPSFLVLQHTAYLFWVKMGTIGQGIQQIQGTFPTTEPEPVGGALSTELKSLTTGLKYRPRAIDSAKELLANVSESSPLWLLVVNAIVLAIVSCGLVAVCSNPDLAISPNSISPAAPDIPHGIPAPPQAGDQAPSGSSAIRHPTHEDITSAMRLGGAGAMIYVIITLGRRNFQRDITRPVAAWCAAQLILGPLLACASTYFLPALITPSSVKPGFPR